MMRVGEQSGILSDGSEAEERVQSSVTTGKELFRSFIPTNLIRKAKGERVFGLFFSVQGDEKEVNRKCMTNIDDPKIES
jgi:hypothetical protein